jgi:RNA polymerase sigma factor (sigma-70 family)
MYSRILFFRIMGIVKNREVAEDVLQKVFLKTLNSFNLYQPEKGRLFTWMLNIARNLSVDEIRSKGYQHGLLNQNLESASNYIEQHYRVNTIDADCFVIKEYMKRMRADQFEILDLVYFKGYTHAEAADELHIPLGTAKTRVRGALQTLRNYFNPNTTLKRAS